MSIRYATKEDIHELFKLNMEEYFPKGFENVNLMDRYEQGMWWADLELFQWHFDILQRADGGILLLIEDNQIIGELDYVLSYDFDAGKPIKRYHIIWLFISYKFRRKGHASRLIKYLTNSVEHDIWVEDEDKRSRRLYEKLGFEYKKILNYCLLEPNSSAEENQVWIRREIIVQNKIYTDLNRMVATGELRTVIGRYYAPSFDIAQLSYPDPKMMIWGQMEPADVIVYEVDGGMIYALMTQYTRVYLKGEISSSELTGILKDLFPKIMEYGFETIELQFYESEIDTDMLLSLGFKLKSDNDYVYKIKRN